MKHLRNFTLALGILLLANSQTSGQTISSMIPDSVYKPLLKAVQKYIFKHRIPTPGLYDTIENWYWERYEDSGAYHFHYYWNDSLRNLFDETDFAAQVKSHKLKVWNQQIGMKRIKKWPDYPHLWRLTIPVFSVNRKWAYIIGTYSNSTSQIGVEVNLLFQFIEDKGWQLVHSQ